MTSNNETVSRQNLWTGNIAKSMTSESNATMLMNFQLENFQLYDKSLKDWSLGKQLILFPSNLNVSFPRDQSLSV